MLIVRCSACSTLLNNRTSSTALCSCFACVCASFVFLLSHPVHNVHAERGQNWLRRLFKGRQTGNSEPAYCLKWLVFGVRRLLVISVQAPCTVATSTLYSHYKHLVQSLQAPCTVATKHLVQSLHGVWRVRKKHFLQYCKCLLLLRWWQSGVCEQLYTIKSF